jgi:hypothetical protein
MPKLFLASVIIPCIKFFIRSRNDGRLFQFGTILPNCQFSIIVMRQPLPQSDVSDWVCPAGGNARQ